MKRIIYLFVLAAIIAACSSEPKYIVKGEIKGSDSLTFILQKRDGRNIVTLDSAISKGGIFRMEGVIEFPQQVMLSALNTRSRASFYLENSEITITGTLDSLNDAKITGSKTQDEYKSFLDLDKPLSDKYQILLTAYQAARAQNDTAKMSKVRNDAMGVEKEMTDLQKQFIKDNPASYFTPALIMSLSYDMSAEEIEANIAALDTNVAKVPAVLDLKTRAASMKAVSVGQKAPDFTLNDVNGNPVSLSSKIGTRLLLIDFWAGWCNPCRQENPNVVKVYNEFHKSGFDVFGVSLDQSKDEWVKAIADDKLTWTHVSDLQYWNNAAARLYAVSSIPANFLLDGTGTIIARNLRGDELYNKVKEVLGAK
ncbi:MAG: TlpA disulfide reductase family protein [Bacteroidia bacterium]|nr:TlpA disulfide reductase family protein [Bacteroidia bacterium]